MPEGVPVGERVSFEGWEGAPEAVLNPKKKLWEKIAPDLKTDAGKHPLQSPCSYCMIVVWCHRQCLACYMWWHVKYSPERHHIE